MKASYWLTVNQIYEIQIFLRQGLCYVAQDGLERKILLPQLLNDRIIGPQGIQNHDWP